MTNPPTADPDFRAPDWNNPIDSDLDEIRAFARFLMATAMSSQRYIVVPGWQTSVDVSTLGNYATPDKWILTKGTMRWEVRFAYAGSPLALDTVQVCYNNGVEGGMLCFPAVSVSQAEVFTIGPELFDESIDVDEGDSSWNDYTYVLDDGVNVAVYDWDFDYLNDSDYIQVYDWAFPVPAGATIVSMSLQFYAWKSSAESPGPAASVSIQNVQAFYAFGTSPESSGPVQTSQEVTYDPAVYTFEGDLAYWGLTNAQALMIVGESPGGWFQFNGNCSDTSVLSDVLNLHVDWVKLTINYTL